MKFYAIYENNELKSIGKVLYGDLAKDLEITETEYNTLLTEIREIDSLVNQLYSGEITIDDVPTGWQEEIQRRVDERIAAEGEAAQQDISAEEALNIILGGETA